MTVERIADLGAQRVAGAQSGGLEAAGMADGKNLFQASSIRSAGVMISKAVFAGVAGAPEIEVSRR